MVITREGMIPKSLSAAIYSVVVGQPSRIQPFVRQSGLSRRVFTKSIMNSFGNGLQDSRMVRYSYARALSLSFLMKSLIKWETLTYCTLNLSANLYACSVFAQPGGPINKMRGGRRGPLDLVSLRILTISSRITPSARLPSSSMIWPLHASLTP
jgi:hypothetical protein